MLKIIIKSFENYLNKIYNFMLKNLLKKIFNNNKFENN